MWTRREFLRTTIASGAAWGARTTALFKAAEGPHREFPTAPRERLSVTSYPFRAFIESPTNPERDRKLPGMDLKDFAAMIAERFGVPNINPLAAHFRSTEPAYLDELRARVQKAKSHIVDLGLGGRNFSDPDPAARTAAIEYGKKWIDIAGAVGSPSVRQHLGAPHRAPPSVELSAKALGRLADCGAKKNVAVILENDDPVGEDPFFIVKVIERAANPYLRALPDMGNSLPALGEERNFEAVRAMFRHAWNMAHVKDTVEGEGGKTFRVDLEKMFAIANAEGYRGYFSMEWESSHGDVYEGTRRLVEESLKYLS